MTQCNSLTNLFFAQKAFLNGVLLLFVWLLCAQVAFAQATPPPRTEGKPTLYLTAHLNAKAPPLTKGVTWRFYTENAKANGALKLAYKTDIASPTVTLDAGHYTIVVNYGLASLVRKVDVRGSSFAERFILDAGAMKVIARNSEKAISRGQSRISLSVPEEGSTEGRLIVDNIKTGDTVRLPVGIYSLVSNFGEANSNVRTDVKIASGKLTEVMVNHRAASITFKLVSEKGGEALANTAWSVLTPGGDIIREEIGAFPKMVLAEGTYTAIARQDDKIYTEEFKVEDGNDRDVEVLAK